MDLLTRTLVGLPQPAVVRDWVVPLLEKHKLLASERIAANLHSVVAVALFYQACYVVGVWWVFPRLVRAAHASDRAVAGSKRRQQVLVCQSSMHLVSLVQAVIVLYLSVRCMLFSEEYGQAYYDAESRVFGRVRETEVICVFAIGYFLWDIYISVLHSSLPFVLHGVISTVVYTIGLKPYIQYYAPVFLMFELSNPTLNVRWFLHKYLPEHKKLQACNDVALIVTFFFCRIAWGWYQIGRLCYDYYVVADMAGFRRVDTAIIVIGNFALDVLNILWFKTMATVAYKTISDKFASHRKSD